MDTLKKCAKCNRAIERKHFYRNRRAKDGLGSYCKSCSSQISAQYRKSKKGKIAKKRADRKYGKSEKGRQTHIKARRKYNRSEKGRAKNKEWWQRHKDTEKGIETRKKSDKKSKEIKRGTNRQRAQSAIAYAVVSKKIPAASILNCSICDKKADHYHHHSYKKEYWFDVIPVCIRCHNNIHLKS